MKAYSCHDFVLSRKQRAFSLFAEWNWGIALAAIICFGIFTTVRTHPIVAILLILVLILTFRGLFVGLIQLFSPGKAHVEINEKGIGFGKDAATWWMFTDGIKQIRTNFWGTTTIRHHNGTFVDIPTLELTEVDKEILFSGLKKYYSYHKLPPPNEQNG